MIKILANTTKMQYHPKNAILQLSCEFNESKWNPWVNMLTSSSGTNCVINEREAVGQYGSYVILSEVMPGYSYPASLVNHFEIFIDSLY